MNRLIIAIRDDKTESFGQPQFVKTKGEAIRMVQQAVNGQPDANNALQNYPEDFTIYAIGEYDDDTGAIKGFDTLDLVAHVKDLKQ